MTEVVDLAELRRLSRRVHEERRPLCPSCGTRAPYDATLDWLRGWGHRCPHGEPCTAWSTPSLEYVTRCAVCAEKYVAKTAAVSGEASTMPNEAEGVGMGETKRKLGDTVECAEKGEGCVGPFVLTHPRQLRCGPCQQVFQRANATAKDRARRKAGSRLSAKARAGAALNTAFEEKHHPPKHVRATPRASAPTAPCAGHPVELTLAMIADLVRQREIETAALRSSANTIAQSHGLPAPYPDAAAAASPRNA